MEVNGHQTGLPTNILRKYLLICSTEEAKSFSVWNDMAVKKRQNIHFFYELVTLAYSSLVNIMY